MVGLPQSPGATGIVLLVVGATIGAALAWRAWRELRAPLTAVMLATVVGATPFVAWRVVEDLRLTTGIERRDAEVYAPLGRGIDPVIYARLRRAIRPGETYFISASSATDQTTAGAFRQWALSALLPRVASETLRESDWIVAWGAQPDAGGIPVTEAMLVHLGDEDSPPVHLGRVGP